MEGFFKSHMILQMNTLQHQTNSRMMHDVQRDEDEILGEIDVGMMYASQCTTDESGDVCNPYTCKALNEQ